jgi:Ca2+-transporting ATPase
MTEHHLGILLIEIAFLLALTFLLASLLARIRIPGILGALFIAMALHYTPIGENLLSSEIQVPLSLLADLGVVFLLFFIGIQIDPGEMRGLGRNIVWLTVLNTVTPFLLGIAVMLALGYGWVIAFVIGLTRMPTAEAVIVPILDEFRLIRTRIGTFIIGAGVLDDIVEVILVGIVSVWISKKTADVTSTITGILLSLVLFVLLAWISRRWLIPRMSSLLPRHPRNLMLLSMVVLFSFAGFSEYSDLGMVVGAIVAGVMMRPTFEKMREVGEQVTQTIQDISYGFLGIIFFFWVGLNSDVAGMIQEPVLAILLFLAAFLGKLIGVFIMVPMGKLETKEAWAIGIGLNARLTTEIIVAQLLFTAGIIDLHLFTALISASALSTIIVPLTFALLVRKWGEEFRAVIGGSANE